ANLHARVERGDRILEDDLHVAAGGSHFLVRQVEQVAALDVSIQGQVITLLRKLRKEFGLTLIFIRHDLYVVRLISDDVLVLYLGRVVEAGDCA
ncbi:hypothetical protein AB9F35_33825, partial [Rhizobium leguminosarum]